MAGLKFDPGIRVIGEYLSQINSILRVNRSSSSWILVPPVTQLFRSKWLHSFFQCRQVDPDIILSYLRHVNTYPYTNNEPCIFLQFILIVIEIGTMCILMIVISFCRSNNIDHNSSKMIIVRSIFFFLFKGLIWKYYLQFYALIFSRLTFFNKTCSLELILLLIFNLHLSIILLLISVND